MRVPFIRVLEAEDKSSALLQAICGPSGDDSSQRFDVDPQSFASLPQAPFVYWASERLRSLFRELPSFFTKGRTAKQGLATADDFRFVRAWWAVPAHEVGECWYPFPKGGSSSPHYADAPLVVNWAQGGIEIRSFCKPGTDRVASRPQNIGFFFRPGITWSARPYKRGAFSLVGDGVVFSHTGAMIFTPTREELVPLLGILNSDAFIGLLHLLMPRGGEGSDRTLKYEIGYVTSVPIPEWTTDVEAALTELCLRAWTLTWSLDSRVETSHSFTLPALLQATGSDLMTSAAAWAENVACISRELIAIQVDLNRRCYQLYGMDEGDRQSLDDSLHSVSSPASLRDEDEDENLEEEPETVVAGAGEDAAALAAELVSWAVGVAFGRFDMRHATGGIGLPQVPGPFDSLPACSPAMLTGSDGLPAQDPSPEYLVEWPTGGILIDDIGHTDHLGNRVRDVFERAFGTAADDWLEQCTRLLGGDLRRWLARSLFGIHLKGYSRSRRKAPLYWQLATPTASYSVWLYAHRANADTLYRVLNDFVTPKLGHEERNLTSLMQEAGSSPTPSQRKAIESQRSFVEELRVFGGEVGRVAPLWRPQLDDGILVTCAPLWRLVPQHRVWQRETKACWTKLTKGEFDWAHLAMHLWPERVVPKCAHDRSLAIAHGLEGEFWAEDADGKWASRLIDAATVERLVQERSSAAVKAALADLLAAG